MRHDRLDPDLKLSKLPGNVRELGFNRRDVGRKPINKGGHIE
jgi:hypothetical protein